MKYFIVIPFFTIAALSGFTQKQNNIWYFGSSAGIDFNSGSPVALTDGALNTIEGCASIADRNNGQLLFYTEGATIWNRTHVPMPNGTGLLGGTSSVQAAIIIPKPQDTSYYYVFTNDEVENNLINGCRYSEVNMELDGGNGDVTNNKNILLLDSSGEKLVAVPHSNGIDIWVIIHKWGGNAFYSYLVTSAGVNPSPVISNVGIFCYNNGSCNVGHLKASPDGTMLATTNTSNGSAEIFLFDVNTGVVSNAIQFSIANYPYGISFSPDNSKLYVSRGYMNFNEIFQFDVSLYDSTTIVNSKTLIAQEPNINGINGSLQIATDGKIYLAIRSNLYLGVINNPNLPGLACNFVLDGFYLDGKYSLHGLPNLLHNYTYTIPASNSNIAPTYSLFIYPNPTTGAFTVQGAIGEIQVYDLFGRKVLESKEPEVDMSGYAKGMYVYVVKGEGEMVIGRGKVVIE